MTGPLLWLIYLLTYSNRKRALLGGRRRFVVWFGLIIGFSDKDRILMENVYFLKVTEQKKILFSNFRIKVGNALVQELNKLLKTAARKLARRQDKVAALKAYRIFFCFSIL